MNLNDYIENIEYFHIGKKTTVCLLILNNGFEIAATSACLNDVAYKEDIGQSVAKELALQKLYEYLTIKKALDFKKEKENGRS